MTLRTSRLSTSKSAASWKLLYYLDQPWGELYDLQNDPAEAPDLWHDPAYDDVRRELFGVLRGWRVRDAL